MINDFLSMLAQVLHRSAAAIEPKPKSRRRPQPSEADRLNAKLEQAQQEIEKLKERNKQLNAELQTAHAQRDRDGDNANSQADRNNQKPDVQQAQQTQQAQQAQQSQQASPPPPRTDDADAASQVKGKAGGFQIGKLYYAFAPTSAQPYGFSMDDWSIEEKGQPFVMQLQSQTDAKFSLTKNEAVRSKLLASLAYYSRMIDYEDATKHQQAATTVKVSDVGTLRKQGNVWTVQKKIKINIH